ncbi:MAG: hypothetical protein M5U19_15040 [Microthrixaceae bacterium]|nr:hypothetical protein [Microthrixaceae bacterium]
MDNETVDPGDLTISHMEDAHPHAEKIKKKVYLTELRDLQIELLKLQQWVKNSGDRIVVIFEGRDAAGKGGDPSLHGEHQPTWGAHGRSHQARRDRTWPVVLPALCGPTCRPPARSSSSIGPGTTGRVSGIVMGFYAPSVRRVLPAGTRLRAEPGGIRHPPVQVLVHRLQGEPGGEFEARKDDPLRQWKYSPVDEASLGKWDEYTRARDAMLIHTDSHAAPWIVINSNEKNAHGSNPSATWCTRSTTSTRTRASPGLPTRSWSSRLRR